MKTIRVGIQLAPQHTNYLDYAQAVRQVEAMGVDTIWNWDHFMPPWVDKPTPASRANPAHGNHFEAWTLLTAMAMMTSRAQVGCLVTCNSFRSPAMLSSMAKTVDQISEGRLILGLGAGWFEKEYWEFGYSFGTPAERLRSLESALQYIRHRWTVDKPFPVRQGIPILVGGEGERVTMRLAAQYADIWNSGVAPEQFKNKNAVLDEWCVKVGRDPATLERSVNVYGRPTPATYDDYVAAGAEHIILNVGFPWDLAPVEGLVCWRNDNKQ